MEFEDFYEKYVELLNEESNGLLEVSKAEAFKIFTAIVIGITEYNKGVEDALKMITGIKGEIK